jgi:hypothetical protein
MWLIRPSIVFTLVCTASAAGAQTTPWGDPDLQGVWSKQTPVPLERPAAIASKPFFTKQEAADLEKNALAVTLKNVAAGIATSGEFNEIYLESEKGRVHSNLRTSLVVDPPDGRIPFTPEGRARWLATPDLMTERATGNALIANSWHDRALQERCITSDAMFYSNAFYNNYHQIVQAPGYVVIVTESMHDVRMIPLDRRAHLGANVKQWVGDSRGWWEGKTLVVETTNINDKRRFLGSTANVRLVERFTRIDPNTINYQLTVTDPKTFSRPWTLENLMWRSDEAIFEVGCHEGNIGLAAILSGARAAEKR